MFSIEKETQPNNKESFLFGLLSKTIRAPFSWALFSLLFYTACTLIPIACFSLLYVIFSDLAVTSLVFFFSISPVVVTFELIFRKKIDVYIKDNCRKIYYFLNLKLLSRKNLYAVESKELIDIFNFLDNEGKEILSELSLEYIDKFKKILFGVFLRNKDSGFSGKYFKEHLLASLVTDREFVLLNIGSVYELLDKEYNISVLTKKYIDAFSEQLFVLSVKVSYRSYGRNEYYQYLLNKMTEPSFGLEERKSLILDNIKTVQIVLEQSNNLELYSKYIASFPEIFFSLILEKKLNASKCFYVKLLGKILDTAQSSGGNRFLISGGVEKLYHCLVEIYPPFFRASVPPLSEQLGISGDIYTGFSRMVIDFVNKNESSIDEDLLFNQCIKMFPKQFFLLFINNKPNVSYVCYEGLFREIYNLACESDEIKLLVLDNIDRVYNIFSEEKFYNAMSGYVRLFPEQLFPLIIQSKEESYIGFSLYETLLDRTLDVSLRSEEVKLLVSNNIERVSELLFKINRIPLINKYITAFPELLFVSLFKISRRELPFSQFIYGNAFPAILEASLYSQEIKFKVLNNIGIVYDALVTVNNDELFDKHVNAFLKPLFSFLLLDIKWPDMYSKYNKKLITKMLDSAANTEEDNLFVLNNLEAIFDLALKINDKDLTGKYMQWYYGYLIILMLKNKEKYNLSKKDYEKSFFGMLNWAYGSEEKKKLMSNNIEVIYKALIEINNSQLFVHYVTVIPKSFYSLAVNNSNIPMFSKGSNKVIFNMMIDLSKDSEEIKAILLKDIEIIYDFLSKINSSDLYEKYINIFPNELRALAFSRRSVNVSFTKFILEREISTQRMSFTDLANRALDDGNLYLLDLVVTEYLDQMDLFQEVDADISFMEKVFRNNKTDIRSVYFLINYKNNPKEKLFEHILIAMSLPEDSGNNVFRKILILDVFLKSINSLGPLATPQIIELLMQTVKRLAKIKESFIELEANSTITKHYEQDVVFSKVQVLKDRFGVPSEQNCVDAYKFLYQIICDINEDVDDYVNSDFYKFAGSIGPNKAEIIDNMAGEINAKVYAARISEKDDLGINTGAGGTLLDYAKAALIYLIQPGSDFWIQGNIKGIPNSFLYRDVIYYLCNSCFSIISIKSWRDYSEETYHNDSKKEILRHRYSAIYVLVLKLYQMCRSYNINELGLDNQKNSGPACPSGRLNILIQFIDEFTNMLEDPSLSEVNAENIRSILGLELDKEDLSDPELIVSWSKGEINDSTALHLSTLLAKSTVVLKENLHEVLKLPEGDDAQSLNQAVKFQEAHVSYIEALRFRPITDKMRIRILDSWDVSLKNEDAIFYAEEDNRVGFLKSCLQKSIFQVGGESHEIKDDHIRFLIKSMGKDSKRCLQLPMTIRQYQEERKCINLEPYALYYLLNQQIKQFLREDGDFSDWFVECLQAWELPKYKLESDSYKKSLAENLHPHFECLFEDRFNCSSIDVAREALALMTAKEKFESRRMNPKPEMLGFSKIDLFFKDLYVVFIKEKSMKLIC